MTNGHLHQVRGPQEPQGSHCPFPLNPSPRLRAKQLPGILSEWCPLVPIWEAKQRDGTEQPLLLLLLAPKQVLPLEGTGKEMSPRCTWVRPERAGGQVGTF